MRQLTVLLGLVIGASFFAFPINSKAQNKHSNLYGYYSKTAIEHPDSLGLSEQWEAFALEEGEGRSDRPKPYKPSYAFSPETGSFQIDTSGESFSQHFRPVHDNIVSEQEIGEVTEELRGVRILFYGQEQSIHIPVEYGSFHPKSLAESDVAAFWSELERHDYRIVIRDYSILAAANGYNDWAAYKWVRTVSEAVFPGNVNCEQEIFSSFLLTKIGLLCRIARISDRLGVMFASSQKVYARRYITVGDVPYYLAEDGAEGTKVFTYRTSPSSIARPFDMRISNPIRLGAGETFHFRKHSSILERDIETDINTGLLSFYEDYPQVDVVVYATGAKDASFSKDLLRCFSDFNAGLGNEEALNLLLKYVQSDFEYDNDFHQFGREKPMFCEECYYYPGNDCEDRCVVFGFLVSNLLGLDVILLDYGDHVCTAVRLDGNEAAGAFVRREDGRYYVCDPTFIGSTVGMVIPDYRSRKPRVIELN